MDGMKGGYISLQHTSIQIIQIDMQGMIGTQRRNEELLPGIHIYIQEVFFQANILHVTCVLD